MCIAREHDDTLDFVTRNLIVENFIGSFFAQLNQAMTGNDNELLPLGVMPMFALGDAWFADVDRDLTALEGVNEFGEGASVVHIHLEVEDGLLLWEIREEGAVESLCERVGRNLWDHESLWHLDKLMKEVNNLAKFYMMCYRSCTIATIGSEYGINPIKLTMMLFTFECTDHFLNEIINGILSSEIAEALVQNPISKLSVLVCRHIILMIDYTLIHSTFLASKASGRASFESILSIAFGGTASSLELLRP